MKPTSPIASPDKPHPMTRSASATPVITDFSYQPTRGATPVTSAAPAKHVAQLKTFRALSTRVFGAEATREYVAEAILFIWIMAVASWPLGVALNQLGTMMISPPHGGIW